MSTEHNKELARCHTECWNQGNVASLEELLAPNFIYHDPAHPDVRSREDYKRSFTESHRLFPDFQITVEIVVTEGDNGQVAGAGVAPKGAMHHACVKLVSNGNTRSNTMRQNVDETREDSLLELWRRAKTHGDLEAWAAFQHGLEETVLTWLYAHPACEAVCRMHNERYYVAQAFAQFQQVVVQGLVDCETISEVLLSLCASLNGVIMEALRISSRPQTERSHGSAEQDLQDNHGSLELWNWVQATLSSVRERRLAYLLYLCGLTPAEIVRGFPHEWSDIHEVAHVRCIVFERLTQGLICVGHTCV